VSRNDGKRFARLAVVVILILAATGSVPAQHLGKNNDEGIDGRVIRTRLVSIRLSLTLRLRPAPMAEMSSPLVVWVPQQRR